MQACQAAGSSNALCGCVWRKIAAEIPVSDFQAFEGLPAQERETHPMTAQLQGYQQTCALSP